MSTLRLRDPSLSLLLWSRIGERSWYLHSYTEKGKTPISLSKWKQALLWAVLCLRMGFKDMHAIKLSFPNFDIPWSWRIRNLVLESSFILSDFCLDHSFSWVPRDTSQLKKKSWVPRDVNTAAHALASWSLTYNLVGSFDLGCCPPAFYEALFFGVSINFLRSLNSFFCGLLFPLIF